MVAGGHRSVQESSHESSDGGIYLSKNGELFGPFSPSDVSKMKKSGELLEYVWICFDVEAGWRPIQPPPRLPGSEGREAQEDFLGESAEEAGAGKKRPTKRKVQRAGSERFAHLSVICVSGRKVLSAKISDANSKSCVLSQVSPESHAIPVLHRGSRLTLNILNPNNSQAESVKAVSMDAIKSGDHWDYVLQWSKLPEILE